MYTNVQATTVVFHQFETGLREGTIYTKVKKNLQKMLTEARNPELLTERPSLSIISSIDKLIVCVPYFVIS